MKKVQLAWDGSLVDQVDAAATAAGLSRTEWVRLAAQHVLDRRVKLGRPVINGAVVGCQHPRESRKQLPYGTLCGVCSILIS